ncbi:hypothetical protein CK203_015490 [Vitis vinifera]|uniref:Uncharacterized protein n=1 Tax=Vitis vinifera TaxID=29760 RepID=A0A438J575_VITVI|nr:hypothetical protein CK203_015490 [Vitis vinifera]
MGLKLKGVVAISAGSEVGQPKRWAYDEVGSTSDLDGARPGKSMVQAKVRRSQEKECLLDCRIASNGSFSEGEHLVIWETEELRKQQEKAILFSNRQALAKEAMGGESYDRSGVLGEINEVGPREDGNGCWDLVEFTNTSNMVRGVEWDSDVTEPQEIKSEKEDRWEEVAWQSLVTSWLFDRGAGKGNSEFSDQIKKETRENS